ncbi:ATP-binding protein [Pilimelia anulata]|nr:ATP-binding protein [Pilimelia anulata]
MSGPTFDDIFAVMARASVGDGAARVQLPAEPTVTDVETRFAVALNVLLDDLEYREAERRRAEERLRQAQKMEAIGSLAGGVAHDFNNLLSVILGYTDLLLETGAAGDLEELRTIRQAAERAAELTGQLLAFSRKQVLASVVLDVNAVLGRLLPIVRRLIGEDVELDVLRGSALWAVKADAGRLEQVILNLIVNSRDAMPRGGRITVETANVDLDDEYAAHHVDVSPGPYVMIAVTDTGTGMDTATLRRVFDPFFTTKEVGKGTGLGLSTVFGIVKQSRGNVWIYSEPGRGTTVKVYLPRTHERPAPPAPADPAAAGGRESVLLVEDEPQVRALLHRILGENGYTVTEAAGPAAALDLLRAGEVPVDLLVTDVVMPGMSGPQLAAAAAEHRPELRVLFLSGYPDRTITHHGDLDERAAFLQKPVVAPALLRKVREVLEPGE